MNSQIKNDLELLKIDEDAKLTVRYVTSKYKRMAKEHHPDKGGNTESFQELLSAYRRVIKYVESNEKYECTENEQDHEKEFFMKNNFMKECSTSIVVYIQDKFVDN